MAIQHQLSAKCTGLSTCRDCSFHCLMRLLWEYPLLGALKSTSEGRLFFLFEINARLPHCSGRQYSSALVNPLIDEADSQEQAAKHEASERSRSDCPFKVRVLALFVRIGLAMFSSANLMFLCAFYETCCAA